MRKNNAFNRIFHRNEILDNMVNYSETRTLCVFAETLIADINQTRTLPELIEHHKYIWKWGYRNENLAPNEFGMFRCSDIESMTAEDVYLGGINGIWTFNVKEFERMKSSDADIYDMVLMQYKHVLTSNIEAVVVKAKQELEEFRKYGYTD